MNIRHITAALVAVILSMSCSSLVADDGTASNSDIVINNILTRTSVRSYLDKPVEKTKVETMLRAAMAAPTGMNRQPWHFTVVTDRAALQALAGSNRAAQMVATAPMAIVVSGDSERMARGGARDLWVQDCAAATENLLLAAHAQGLGAVWTSTYPNEQRMQDVTRALNLPENLVPFNIVIVGYPDGENTPKDKWDPDKVTYLDGTTSMTVIPKAEPTLQPMEVNRDFRENGFNFFADNAPILLAGDKDGYNAMTIGWGAIGNIWGMKNRPTMTVYVAQKRYTREFMDGKKYFTVMTFKDRKIAEFMGHNSGRDTDKAAALGLHVAYTDNGTPYFTEADMVIECEIMYGEQLDEKGFRNEVPEKMYSNFPAGIHSMYMGQVVSALKKQ